MSVATLKAECEALQQEWLRLANVAVRGPKSGSQFELNANARESAQVALSKKRQELEVADPTIRAAREAQRAAAEKARAEDAKRTVSYAPIAKANGHAKHNGTAQAAKPGNWRPHIQRAADVTIERLDPLWPGVIFKNYLNLVAGEPGLGKSVLQCAVAAIVTTGGQWPCSNQRAERGTVLFLTAEDRPEDVIVPRLIANGADLDRVHFLKGAIADNGAEREIDLIESLPILAEAVEKTGATLVCIDPITAFENASVDSHKNSDVRGMLKPVQALMTKYNAALWAVSHFNKNAGASGLNRIMGSIAYTAASRSAYAVIRDRENDDRLLLLNAKLNLAPSNRGGYSYTLEDVKGHPRLVWGTEPVAGRLDDHLHIPPVPKKERAAEFLKALLASGEKLPAKDLFEAMQAQGIGEKSTYAALRALGAQRSREGSYGAWMYQLREPIAVTDAEFEKVPA